MLESLKRIGAARMLGVGVVVCGVGLLLATPALIGTNRVESGGTGTMPPQFFPVVAIGILILSGLFLLASGASSTGVERGVSSSTLDRNGSVATLWVAIIVAVFPGAILHIGTYWTVPLLVAIIAITLGERRVFMILAPMIAVTVFVYGLGKAINILFP